jgi:6-phosphogluconate dehydrogenase (decarboxylating)
MKIALVGHGRMGREVERVALTRGHEICAVFDVDAPLEEGSSLNMASVLIWPMLFWAF